MLYSQAELIKHHRELKGMTQAQLAEGICSRFHIVKAEAGTRKLSDFTFKDVLLKLGLNPRDFNVGINTEDNDTLFYLQMEEAMRNPDYLTSKEKCIQIKNDIDNYLSGLKEEPANPTHWKELKLHAEIFIHMTRADSQYKPIIIMSDVLKVRECATEAIKLFRPDFDLDKIETYYLTRREYGLLNTIAATYRYTDDVQKNVEILEKLKANFEKHNKNFYENRDLNEFYSILIGNIGIGYKFLDMWEKALELNTYSMKLSSDTSNFIVYAQSLYNKADALMKLGRTDEGKEHFKRFFMYIIALGDGYGGWDISQLKKMYEDEFGGTIDIMADW